jgi:hypothetical protein
MKAKDLLLLAVLIIGAVGILGGLSALPPSYGVALPSGSALFETSLQDRITPSDTSMTLVTNSLRGGEALAGYNCFTIDEGRSDSEFVCGTVSGTSVTALERGLSFTTGTTSIAALKQSHRKGANVKITDYPLIQRMKAVLNGEDTIPNLLTYTNTILCGVGSATTTVCPKYYIDQALVSGAPNADDTTKGIVERATAAEAGASTATGATGAALFLGANIAIANPSTGCSVFCIPIATAGKISANYIATTSPYAFTGGVSSTGTTTVSASSLTTNPFVINTLAFKFPSARAASSTVLTEDGSGNLQWYTPGSRMLYINGNEAVSSANTSTTTVSTYAIPANTLSARTVVRVTSMWNGNDSSACYDQIDFGSGTATRTIAYIDRTNSSSLRLGRMDTSIFSTSTTGQYGYTAGYTPTTNGADIGAGTVTSGNFYMNANAAALTYIDFRVRVGAGGGTCGLVGKTVELLTY